MQEQNKILFFILIVIVLVVMFFMGNRDGSSNRSHSGSKNVSIEASPTP